MKQHSPFLSTQHQDYLLDNGFHRDIVDDSRLVFTRGDAQVYIQDDVAVRYNDGDDDNSPRFKDVQRVSEVSAMDEMQWACLLHALDIVPMDVVERPEIDMAGMFDRLGKAMVAI